jgi:hypothetical protein
VCAAAENEKGLRNDERSRSVRHNRNSQGTGMGVGCKGRSPKRQQEHIVLQEISKDLGGTVLGG